MTARLVHIAPGTAPAPTKLDWTASSDCDPTLDADGEYCGETLRYNESTYSLSVAATALPAALAVKLLQLLREIDKQVRGTVQAQETSPE